MKFADIHNPTEAELREWAQTDGSYPEQVEQDWDLIVADWSRVDLITELAADESCPTHPFFLAVLYLMAGDCVRTPAGTANIPNLKALLERLENTLSEPLRLFRTRTLTLLADPSTFDYNQWCDGDFAYGRSMKAWWRPKTFKEGGALAAVILFFTFLAFAIGFGIRGILKVL
jgi:hypothetical protein